MSSHTRVAILKMAQFVAKNGADFEHIVRGRDVNFAFGFLEPRHRWYNFYAAARTSAIQVRPVGVA